MYLQNRWLNIEVAKSHTDRNFSQGGGGWDEQRIGHKGVFILFILFLEGRVVWPPLPKVHTWFVIPSFFPPPQVYCSYLNSPFLFVFFWSQEQKEIKKRKQEKKGRNKYTWVPDSSFAKNSLTHKPPPPPQSREPKARFNMTIKHSPPCLPNPDFQARECISKNYTLSTIYICH